MRRRALPLVAALHGDSLHDETRRRFSATTAAAFRSSSARRRCATTTARRSARSITFRDVTEKRAAALAAEAERRYREAEAQNRAKDNFLATLSHELRTPMTSILGWVQFLRYGGFSERSCDEALRDDRDERAPAGGLIDDMLDVSRIILGKFQVELRPTHLERDRRCRAHDGAPRGAGTRSAARRRHPDERATISWPPIRTGSSR